MKPAIAEKPPLPKSAPAPAASSPIFVLCVTQRSGTAYIGDLLALHPDCAGTTAVHEDFVLADADLLGQYATEVFGRWNPKWGVSENVGSPDELLSCLGDGITSFLERQIPAGKRLVTKTPSVENIDYCLRLFPRAHFVIVMRDGRSVVESGVRSRGWSYESGARRWRSGARAILDFDRRHRDSAGRYRIIRYEDVFADPEAALRPILTWLGLDPAVYDFDGARNLPIRGSSDIPGAAKERIHWQPVERTRDFDPMHRWKTWPLARHERFNWLAGDQLEAFGYEPMDADRAPVRNRLLDARWHAVRRLREWVGRRARAGNVKRGFGRDGRRWPRK